MSITTKRLSFSSRLAFKQYDKTMPVSAINMVKPQSQKVSFGDLIKITVKQKKIYPKSPPRSIRKP